MAELKPCKCRWCNNEKEDWLYVMAVDILGETMFQVKCHNCGARGPLNVDEEAAISAWNGRIINEETNS